MKLGDGGESGADIAHPRIVEFAFSNLFTEFDLMVRNCFLVLGFVFVSVTWVHADTTFLAHFDGNTGNGGLDADYAVGSKVAIQGGAAIVPTTTKPSKFGAGSLSPSTEAGYLSYSTAGNISTSAGTVEMWVQTDDWESGAYEGLFNLQGFNNPNAVDIRLWKRNDDTLQAYMENAGPDPEPIWFLRSLSNFTLDSGWHHLAFTWDTATQSAAMYHDGVVINTPPTFFFGQTDISFDGTVNAEFQVGHAQGGLPFNGLIDEFRFSDVDLYGGGVFGDEVFTPLEVPFETPVGFLDADFNEDTFVNGTDLATWETNFGLSGTAIKADGDADFDMDVDGSDLLTWQRQFGMSSGLSASSAAVPEPTSLLLVLLGSTIALTAARRR